MIMKMKMEKGRRETETRWVAKDEQIEVVEGVTRLVLNNGHRQGKGQKKQEEIR